LQVDNYLRLALLLGDNKASTFTKNLEKMITLILFEVEKKSRETNEPSGLTVVEIIEHLEKSYHITFSDAEILAAIDGKHQKRIVCSEKTRDFAQYKYSISTR